MDFYVDNLIKLGSRYLSVFGFQRPRHESILIIKNILEASYIDIFSKKETKVSSKECKNFLDKLYLRMKGKPISKIFGEKEFYSRMFITSENNLDPRPETEMLVDLTINFANNLKRKKIEILELGTGSGCVIITVTLELLPKFIVEATAVDICKKALSVAKKNLEKFNLKKKICLKESDWFEKLNDKFDLIVSNPPYIKNEDIKKLSNEVLCDPLISLDGGKNGIRSYINIAKDAKKYLKNNGYLILEFGKNQFDLINEVFTKSGFKKILKEKDLQGIDRIVVYQYKVQK